MFYYCSYKSLLLKTPIGAVTRKIWFLMALFYMELHFLKTFDSKKYRMIISIACKTLLLILYYINLTLLLPSICLYEEIYKDLLDLNSATRQYLHPRSEYGQCWFISERDIISAL